MTTTITTTIWVERDNQDYEIECTGEFVAGDPGVHTYANGDPGYPGTDDDIRCFKSTLGGEDFELTAREREEALEKMMSKA